MNNTIIRPKILYLCAWYPTIDMPLAGIFIKKYAQCVAPKFNVAVIHIKQTQEFVETYKVCVSETEQVSEIIVYYKKNLLAIAPIINLFRFLISFIKAWKIYLKQFGKPNLVHVNILTRFGVLAYFLKIIYSIPYVITEHWTRYLPGNNNFNGFFRKLATKMVCNKAAAITVVSKDLEKGMKSYKLYNNNYQIIYNVVNTEIFKITPTTCPNNKIRIVHVTNFYNRNKNIVGILDCIKELSKHRSDFELHCIGINENDPTDYSVLAQDMGILNSFVFFRGLMNETELSNEFNLSAFSILYSNFENLPVVVLESWACGIPVLVTNVGGLPEHITPQLGLMVEPLNNEAFTNELTYMLDNYKSFNRETIQQYANQHFSKEIIASQLATIYINSMKQ